MFWSDLGSIWLYDYINWMKNSYCEENLVDLIWKLNFLLAAICGVLNCYSVYQCLYNNLMQNESWIPTAYKIKYNVYLGTQIVMLFINIE